MGYMVLLLWPVIAAFSFAKKQTPVAVACAIIVGFLLMPPNINIDFPLLPAINKNSMAALAALLTVWVISKRRPKDYAAGAHLRPKGIFPTSVMPRLCLVMIICGAFMTVFTNSERLTYGFTTLPGLRPYDAASHVLFTCMEMLPLLIARKFMADPDSHKRLLIIFAISATIYCFPALFEIRMSPQINRMVYGFFPHNWAQHIRSGGFRPLVFMEHGLLLGLVLSTSILACLALWRQNLSDKAKRSGLILFAALFILATLVLAKTLGPLILAVLFGATILLTPPRIQALVAAGVVVIILSYPMLRNTGLIPVDYIVAQTQAYDVSRGGSLKFRVDNEKLLLAKANEKPLFGWGPRGRMRVFDEEGYDISVTDGRWIIAIGMGGWTRYLSEFGLLCFAIIGLAWRRKQLEINYITAGLMLMLAANMVDLIPNDGLTPLTWLISGALLGRYELKTYSSTAQDQSVESASKRAKASKSSDDASSQGLKPLHASTIVRSSPNSKLPYSRQRAVHKRNTKKLI